MFIIDRAEQASPEDWQKLVQRLSISGIDAHTGNRAATVQ